MELLTFKLILPNNAPLLSLTFFPLTVKMLLFLYCLQKIPIL